MLLHMRHLLYALAVILTPAVAFACMFDTDCSPGSRCVKGRGAIYGVCAGGLYPGNDNDRTPTYDPLDPNGTSGSTCSFDADCGPGSRCVKSSGSISGVCMRRR
jgi:hypothetical protein